MSRAAKLTLAGTTFMAAATIVIVHYGQSQEKAVCFCLPTAFLIFCKPWEIVYEMVLMQCTGNARRRNSRHGSATIEEGTPARLRYAKGIGGGI